MFIGYKTKPHPLVELRNRILRLRENADRESAAEKQPQSFSVKTVQPAKKRVSGAAYPIGGGRHA